MEFTTPTWTAPEWKKIEEKIFGEDFLKCTIMIRSALRKFIQYQTRQFMKYVQNCRQLIDYIKN